MGAAHFHPDRRGDAGVVSGARASGADAFPAVRAAGAVFDSEKNRHGRLIGYPGRAKEALDTLAAIEGAGDEVTVQCPVLGIDAVRCTIERIEFQQASNPPPGKSYGLGGYANLVFRTTT
jgi:hypothetical protein